MLILGCSRQYNDLFLTVSSKTRHELPHDVTLKMRFISDKSLFVISVFAGRNVIALTPLIFRKVDEARDYDLFFSMHNTVE